MRRNKSHCIALQEILFGQMRSGEAECWIILFALELVWGRLIVALSIWEQLADPLMFWFPQFLPKSCSCYVPYSLQAVLIWWHWFEWSHKCDPLTSLWWNGEIICWHAWLRLTANRIRNNLSCQRKLRMEWTVDQIRSATISCARGNWAWNEQWIKSDPQQSQLPEEIEVTKASAVVCWLRLS